MIAITLLALGVATLNQYWERDTDPLMERTATRPLPTRRVTIGEALVFGIALCAVAEIYLLLAVNALTAFLGLVVIIGYVFIYTPLKTRTSASTAIGALPGALPPLMGWTAAANDITLGAWAAVCHAVLVAVSAFFRYCVDVSRGICKGRYPNASGRRTGREDHRETDRNVCIYALPGQPCSVLYRIVRSDFPFGSGSSRDVVPLDQHSGGTC